MGGSECGGNGELVLSLIEATEGRIPYHGMRIHPGEILSFWIGKRKGMRVIKVYRISYALTVNFLYNEPYISFSNV